MLNLKKLFESQYLDLDVLQLKETIENKPQFTIIYKVTNNLPWMKYLSYLKHTNAFIGGNAIKTYIFISMHNIVSGIYIRYLLHSNTVCIAQ